MRRRGAQIFGPRQSLDSYSLVEMAAQGTAFLLCWTTGLRLRLSRGCAVLRSPLSPLDYATVQTVGMTLATIMFVLGIIIILSKCPPHLWGPPPPGGGVLLCLPCSAPSCPTPIAP